MRIFKNKLFSQWAEKEGLKDEALIKAIDEMINGLYEANLGGNIYKKRVALPGQGKRNSVRTIIAYHSNDRAIFLFGFAKNQHDNITKKEELALKKLAKLYLTYKSHEIVQAIQWRELIEVIK